MFKSWWSRVTGRDMDLVLLNPSTLTCEVWGVFRPPFSGSDSLFDSPHFGVLSEILEAMDDTGEFVFNVSEKQQIQRLRQVVKRVYTRMRQEEAARVEF